MSEPVDVVIPSYNGLKLLKKNLKTVVKHTPGLKSLIIIDDASTDSTEEFVRQNYPKAIYLKNSVNLGFVHSVNRGFEAANSEFVVLLNNDVIPEPGYLSSLRFFEDKTVSVVNFNEQKSSWPDVFWSGKLQYIHGQDKSVPRFVAWGSGGSAVFRLKHWRELDGFDPVYSPGYWEDIDYGWRAWRSGYRIVWDPKSLVNHNHESTFNKLNPRFISDLKQTNELIFNWKNITGLRYRASHLIWLLGYCLRHPGYLRIVIVAFSRFLESRLPSFIVSDKQVLSQVNRACADV